MQPGDLVRIRPSRRLSAPWSAFAQNRIVMRVKRIEPRGCYDPPVIKVVDPVTHRHGWFEESELEPLTGVHGFDQR